MSGILGIGGGGDTGFYDFPLEQSLRFNNDDGAYLEKTFTTTGNRRTFTISFWFKRCRTDTAEYLFTGGDDVSNRFHMDINASGTFQIEAKSGGSTQIKMSGGPVLRDVGAWYHFVLRVDTTQSTASDRVRLYVNGDLLTFDSNTYPSQNADLNWNLNDQVRIGRAGWDTLYFDGYFAEFINVDGSSLAPTSFGETKNGIWIPKQYTGSYGTNGFHLTFEDDTTVEGFNTVTYTGNGASKSVDGVGFEPDFVWIKSRTNSYNHELYDTVRGVQKAIQSSTTATETTETQGLLSFDSDGFSVGSRINVNEVNDEHVAWCWNAGGAPTADNSAGAGNTPTAGSVKIDGANLGSALAGTIPATRLSANTTRGFSIVTYTGTGSAGTIAHGLSAAPTMIIVKKRTNDTQSWLVYHVGNVVDESGSTVSPEDEQLTFNTDAYTVTDSTIWNDTAPTSTVFSVGNGSGTNELNDTYVAYCWTDISGYSKMGNYTGNGSSGHAITTGFAPAWLMVKRADAVNSWYIVDNTRTVNTAAGNDDLLYANLSNNEGSTNDFFTFTSTGFELNTSSPAVNTSNGDYIYMAFADTREYAFWTDQSGNNNDFQHHYLEHTDVMRDRPTNNFCTVNQLSDVSNIVLAEGNLNLTNTADSWPTVRGTMGVSSGKWYYEVAHSDATRWGAGWATKEFQSGTTFSTNIADSILGYSTDPLQVYDFGTLRSINGTPAFTTSDILQVAIDVDAGKFWLGINNTWVNDSGGTAGDPAGGSNELETFTAGTEVFPSFVNNRGNLTVNFGQDSTFAGVTAAGGNTDQHGNGDFKYSVPSGFLALCTDNLPNPSIDPNAGQTPDEYFNTVLYQGNSGTQSITGVGFQPDFLWVKNRATAYSHALADVVRGATKSVSSDSNAAERTSDITSLDSDGFSLQFVNATGSYSENQGSQNYVAWNWKAGGTAVSNTDGTVNSSVSANTEAGFSIVTFTGGAAGYTVGHGLSQAPEIVFTFNRTDTAGANYVFTTVIDGSIDYFNLDGNTAKNNDPFSMSAFTSSVFSLDNDYGMDTGDNCVAYCFHSVEGYSKIGTYTGNASTDGAFVYTGFRPAFVMTKRAGSSTSNWPMFDNKRDVDNVVEHIHFADLSGTELSPYDRMDFVSNGFKLRDTGSGVNNSDTILFMAFAEQPFKYANAR